MSLPSSKLLLLITALSGILSSACQSGGVGDPCIPEDEYRTNFGGYQETEVNVESRSFQCETRVCLVANFRGRVSCPYGQAAAAGTDPTKGALADTTAAADDRCYLPGKKPDPNNTANVVTVPVPAQLVSRPPDKAVYCSCRCDGPDKNAGYCDCPSGYRCQNLVNAYVAGGGGQLVGSYCIKEGTEVTDPTKIAPGACATMGPTFAPRPQGCGTNKHPDGI